MHTSHRVFALLLVILGLSSLAVGHPVAQQQSLDPGVDIATVIVANANFRGGPSTSADIVLQLPRGETLALVDRAPNGPWFNAIHIESGEEGWIHGSTITISYTKRHAAAPALQAERLADQ